MFNESSSPTVANCSFSGNSAVFGGGMYNRREVRRQFFPRRQINLSETYPKRWRALGHPGPL